MAVIVQAPEVWGDTVAALIVTDDTRDVVHLTVPGVPPVGEVDPFALLGLVPAMRTGQPLVVEAPVSARLLEGMGRGQEILAGWFPELFRVVPVEADARAPGPPAGGRKVASFYTGGVDSSYLAVTHRDELDALVTVHAFFAERGWVRAGREFRDGIRAGARGIGLPLVEVFTNARQFLQPFCGWVEAHGIALAAVAQALAGAFREVRIGSSQQPNDMLPWGSHPLLDPWWSSDEVEFVHVGEDTARLEKLAALARHPEVMRWLQVCWQVDRTAYNCGRCEKCLRTALDLRAVGAAGACPSLPAAPSLLRQALRVEREPTIRAFAERRLEEAERRGDRRLAAAVGVHLALSRADELARRAVRPLRRR